MQASDDVVLEVGSKERQSQDLAIVGRHWSSLDRQDSSLALGKAVRLPQRANERRIGMSTGFCASGDMPPPATQRQSKRQMNRDAQPVPMKNAFRCEKPQGHVWHSGCGQLDDKPVLDQANRPDRLERLFADAKPALGRIAQHAFDSGCG